MPNSDYPLHNLKLSYKSYIGGMNRTRTSRLKTFFNISKVAAHKVDVAGAMHPDPTGGFYVVSPPNPKLTESP